MKKVSDFNNVEACNTKRQFNELIDGLQSDTSQSDAYAKAIIMKDVFNGFFAKEFKIEEFEELVSEGYEGNFLNEESGRLKVKQFAKELQDYAKYELRKPLDTDVKGSVIIDGEEVAVTADAIFQRDGYLEFVNYKIGRPILKSKGKNAVNQDIRIRLLLEFGIQYAKKLGLNKKTVIMASYYYMKHPDKTAVGFTTKQMATVSEEIVDFTKESDNMTVLRSLLSDFEKGKECSEEDCAICAMKGFCNYQKQIPLKEEKTQSNKNGKITPSAQQEQIISFRKGYCRVNATAGSGKTECMTERGARMIEEGVSPKAILFITYTDAGAREMKERIVKKLAARNLAVSVDDIQAMTFNTFAYQIVKAEYTELGFTKEPEVIDDVTNRKIIASLINRHPIIPGFDYQNFDTNLPAVKGVLPCIEKGFEILKAGEDISELGGTAFRAFVPLSAYAEIEDLYEEYKKLLIENNLVTFSDQEAMMNVVLKNHPGYLNRFGYKHLIVDEFQDSNDVQLATIKCLCDCPTFESLMVVGDDSQAIYGFRKTSPENIINFFQKLGVTGQDLYLVENRRSTPQITEFANQIIDLNTVKVAKIANAVRDDGHKPIINGFCSKEDEVEWVAEKIQKKINAGVDPENIAFIAATKAELMKMASALSKRNIAFVLKNPMTLVENSRVLAAISLANAFYNPENTINYFNYLVAKTDGELFNLYTQSEIKTILKDMKLRFTHISNNSLNYQRLLFHKLLEDIKGTDEIYAHFLDLLYRNPDLTSELEYIQDFKRYGSKVAVKMEQDYAGVVLTTAHSSKGLEWPVVFASITNFDAEILHQRSKSAELEEKRRLLFVTITRARDELYISSQYAIAGKKDERVYNQFLKEVMEINGDHYDPIQAEYQYELKKQDEKMKKKTAALAKKLAEETA